MGIYDVDYITTSGELLPPIRRDSDAADISYSLAAPLNELDTIFNYLREGTGASDYSGATTYLFGNLVNYQRRVYYKNEITDGYIAGITPNNTTYFVKVLDYTIGLDERIRYSPNKLILEYALNSIFGTTFNQPPTLSDIYITRTPNTNDCFEIGQTAIESSTVTQNEADAEWSIPQFEPDGSIQYDYTVNVPVAVWTALAGSGSERDNIILSVLAKYKLYGFIATVAIY